MDPIQFRNPSKSHEINVHYVKSSRLSARNEEIGCWSYPSRTGSSREIDRASQSETGILALSFCQGENYACVNACVSCIKGGGKDERSTSHSFLI